MKLKATVQSLSFVLVASVSSLALAQGLGVGAGVDARVDTPRGIVPGSTQSPALGARTGVAADVNTNNVVPGSSGASGSTQGVVGGAARDLNGAASSATNAAGSAVDTTTDQARSVTGAAADRSATATADAKADARKAKKAKHAKPHASDSTKAGVNTNVKGDTSSGS
jgi:hypothetical protein